MAKKAPPKKGGSGLGIVVVFLAGVMALGGGHIGGGSSSGSSSSSGSYGSPSSSETSCIVSHESSGVPTAYNSSSGAGGLYQFELETWMETPEGPSYPGGAQTAPASVQTEAYYWEYSQNGDAPWCPSDNCCDGNPD